MNKIMKKFRLNPQVKFIFLCTEIHELRTSRQFTQIFGNDVGPATNLVTHFHPQTSTPRLDDGSSIKCFIVHVKHYRVHKYFNT
jgi:hypothetical protein